MNNAEAVAFMVLVLAVAGVIRSFFKYRSAAPTQLAADADTLAQLRKLEDRVKALEAVVSDTSYQLKEKFRELEKH